MTKTIGGGGANAAQLFGNVAQERQTVAQVADGSHLQSIYVLERDSKFIYEYDIVKKVVFRRQVNMQTSFQHNFAYIQTPSDKLFLIGGGDIQRKPPSLKQCFQIVNNGTSVFDCLSMDDMKY